jgi:8-oxo-dGTP pyrophosphatase MutT (NUDIX family)
MDYSRSRLETTNYRSRTKVNSFNDSTKNDWRSKSFSGFESSDVRKRSEKQDYPVKKSYGIILCRKNNVSGQPEALLVHKRYTYAYSEFVHGHYSGRDTSRLISLFELMTPDELLDIWSLNFDQIWYRVWLSYEHNIHYNKKFKKFHNVFIKDDSGVKLRRLVESVKVHGSLYYEFPKGKKIVENFNINGDSQANLSEMKYESDLDCAIREFKEETNIDKKYYKIVYGFKKVHSYVHGGVRYIHTYYLAIAKKGLENNNIKINVINGEVLDMKWMDLNNIKLVDSQYLILQKLVKPAFNVMKKYFKNKISNYISENLNINSKQKKVSNNGFSKC